MCPKTYALTFCLAPMLVSMLPSTQAAAKTANMPRVMVMGLRKASMEA